MSSMYGQSGPTGMTAGNKIPKGYSLGRLQNFTPEQMQLFQSLFSHLGPESFLSKLAGGSPEAFEQMEAPALRQFAGLQGNIASRFSGGGGGGRQAEVGGRHSSGFQNTMNQASSNFAQDLQSRRTDLQRQAMHDLFGLSSNLLGQRPYDQFLMEKKPTFLQSLMGGLGNAGGQAAGMGGNLAMLAMMGLI